MQIRKLTFTALFIAIGVLTAHLIYIPIGIAKCFPIQSTINILLAVLVGTRYSVSAAFSTALLRNILGTGSLLAFPGSMIGAFFAGILFKKTNHIVGAIVGEVVGTGILGSLVAFPIAKYIIGSQVGAFFFVIPFLISATGGSMIAYLLYRTPMMKIFNERIGRTVDG